MFNELNALIFFLLPEFQMTVITRGNDEVRPKKSTNYTNKQPYIPVYVKCCT